LKSKQVITLTNAASQRASYLLGKRGKESLGIKIKVISGGCSGLKYSIEYADEVGKFDEIIETAGIKVIIDAKAVLHLVGSEMDYVETQFKSGFTFKNPNQKGGCGCGESFHT
jgi:iron-sulfur cluster assembly protein